MRVSLEQFAGQHEEMLDDRSQNKRRHEGQGSHEENGSDDQAGEKRSGDRKCSCAFRHELFACELAGQREDRHDHRETSEEHGEAECDVIPRRIGREAGEGAAIISCA